MKFWPKTLLTLSGPLVFTLLLIIGPPQNMQKEAFMVLASTIWIAIWWITEVIPIPATSLLPIVLFPLTGAIDIQTTAQAYASPIIFLFVGGFILAIAIEKWNLHKRIALIIVSKVGLSPSRIVLGFMLASGGLSMWISNTATAVMMMPLAVAVVSRFLTDNKDNFAKALMLSIAYAASIGGIATLIGTPTNLVLSGVLEKLYNVEISFADWLIFAFPVSFILLILCWIYLVRFAFPLKNWKFPAAMEEIQLELKNLGKISYEEKWLIAVFSLTAFAWIFRSLLLTKILPGLDDAIIALIAGIVLFIIPAKDGTTKLMNWKSAVKLPWGIVLLFGGGLSMAVGFQESGLSEWIGNWLFGAGVLPLILIMFIVITLVNFLTEVTSNVATASMILPILGSIAVAINIHPYALMVGATMAASCAFMLPVATPPNAVVFGSGLLKMKDMAKTGFALNIISIVVILFFTYVLLAPLWGIDLNTFPEAFKK